MREDFARCRVALYSHDTMGIGHIRRNLLIAQALGHSELRPITLLLAGAREASAFALPPDVDCVTLPALHKEGDGHYRSRSLGIPTAELVSLRAKTICAALEAFEPDVLIVDKAPRGALGEVDLALARLRVAGRTRVVLGLRDVLDEPAAVRREWLRLRNEDAIGRFYDAVWVYGDRRVYDLVREYGLSPAVAAKVRFTGYFDQRERMRFAQADGIDPLQVLGLPPGRLVLCIVGGGQDGGRVAEAFAAAEMPPDTNAVILTGPNMPIRARRELYRRAARNPRLRVVEFLREPALLLDRADRVVAMGGYNTVWEVLSFEKRALIVPRVKPRREQWVRAERLRALGLVDVLHPADLTPDGAGRVAGPGRARAVGAGPDRPERPGAAAALPQGRAHRPVGLGPDHAATPVRLPCRFLRAFASATS